MLVKAFNNIFFKHLHSAADAGPLADSWRQATGTPVWGIPYGRTRTRRASRPARTPSARHWPSQRGDRRPDPGTMPGWDAALTAGLPLGV
jgi:hypothetical protein